MKINVKTITVICFQSIWFFIYGSQILRCLTRYINKTYFRYKKKIRYSIKIMKFEWFAHKDCFVSNIFTFMFNHIKSLNSKRKKKNHGPLLATKPTKIQRKVWSGPWTKAGAGASAAVPGVMSGHNHTTGELGGTENGRRRSHGDHSLIIFTPLPRSASQR